jgi:hypothetical protein
MFFQNQTLEIFFSEFVRLFNHQVKPGLIWFINYQVLMQGKYGLKMYRVHQVLSCQTTGTHNISL